MIEAFGKFIDTSFEAVARAQVGASFARLAKAFGYETSLILDIRSAELSLASAVVFPSPLVGDYPRPTTLPFTTHPLFLHSINTDQPFALREMCEAYKLRESVMRAWMPEPLRRGDVLSLPVHRDGALVLYVGCSGAAPDLSPLARATLHTAAHIAFDRIAVLADRIPLSDREADCLFLAAQGKNYDEIARALHVSTRTVRAAVATAKTSLNAKTKAEAIAKVIALTAR